MPATRLSGGLTWFALGCLISGVVLLVCSRRLHRTAAAAAVAVLGACIVVDVAAGCWLAPTLASSDPRVEALGDSVLDFPEVRLTGWPAVALAAGLVVLVVGLVGAPRPRAVVPL